MTPLLTDVLIKDHFGNVTGNLQVPKLPFYQQYQSQQQQQTGSTKKIAFQPPVNHQFANKQSYQPSAQRQARPMSHGGTRSTSPDGSNTSGGNSSSHNHTAKTGRKGDPRMHRAVAARLADPNMTLFEALKAGGFDYPDDNNPNYLDSEKITLAQRKNQLSRRLRIARCQDNFGCHPAPSPTDNKNKFESLVEKQKQSFQMMQQTMELERRTSSGASAAGGLKRARSASQKESDPNQTGAGERSLLDEDDETEQKQPAPMMAKFHPQFQHMMVQPTGMQYAQSAPVFQGVAQNQAAFAQNGANGMFFQSHGFQVPNMAPAAAQPAANGNVNNAGASSNTAAPSGVAIRSLTNTAQTAGLSLEQLALALSSTRNLAQVVLGEEDDKDTKEQNKKKHDLALQLYQNEARPIYARCMLLAGYKSEKTTEDSKEYLKFAWHAWQKEGRRLRDMLEENDMLVDDAPGLDDKKFTHQHERPTKKTKTDDEEHQNGDSGAHHHSHTHKRDCHTEDGRHIHRLEKCGHKPILHQPKDGEAHIDFVVGDKVECYGGFSSSQDGSAKAWPSHYQCDKCDSDEIGLESVDIDQVPKENAPKILDIKDVDLEGGEWNVDFDDTLHGLVRLGEGLNNNNHGSRADSMDTTANSFPGADGGAL